LLPITTGNDGSSDDNGDSREGIHRSSTFAPFDDLLLAVIFVYLPLLLDGSSLRK